MTTIGWVGNIQKYSIHDGPGIRTTVFLKGCPLSCLWCHNPENRMARPQLTIYPSRCIRCGACVEACPQGGAEAGAHPAPGFACSLCGACVGACPSGARHLVGRPMSVDEVLEEITQDRIFYEESQGGATFSGGEPLLQADFLTALLAGCQARGIHTAVDTCGYAPRQTLLSVSTTTDLFLYDLKAVEDERHRRLTGVSNALILDNLKYLSQIHANIWLRIPIIPSLNDLPSELEAMAEVAASLSGVRQVHLLPYHRTATHKFARLEEEYALPEIAPPSRVEMETLRAPFQALGLHTIVGG